jgi:hypothetical protein
MHKAQGIPLTVRGLPSPTVLQTGPFCLDIGSRHSAVDMSDGLDSDRISRLESIGFIWNPLDLQWEEMESFRPAMGGDVCQAQGIWLTAQGLLCPTVLQKGSFASWTMGHDTVQ